MTQYADIMNMPRSEIKEPQPLPVGSYTAVVKGTPRIDKAGKNNTDIAEIEFALVAAGADVNPDDLAASGGLPRDFKHTFWMTEKSVFIVDRFLEAAGISKAEAGTLGEALFQTPGRSVTISVVMGKANPKTGKSYPEITQFAAA